MVERRTLTLLALVCVGHVLLISAQVQSRAGTPLLHGMAFGVFARMQAATARVADTASGLWSHYVALGGAARENEALRRQVLELEGRLQRQEARLGEVAALEEALGLRAAVGFETLVARVIAGSPTPGSDRVTIDRGERDGVRPDMAVLSGDGVVGRVIGPIATGAATVQLLTGPRAAIAVVLERSGAGGIARGGAEAGTLFRVEYISPLAEVRPGERVTASGLDGIYPEGLLIGTVDRVEPSEAGGREILVRPAVDFSNLDLVLVVLPGASDTTGDGDA